METDAIVHLWCTRDETRAVLPADHELIDATRSLRALVVEAVLSERPGRDLFQACADLGRYLGERGASPSLAALTLDGAREAMPHANAPWEPMRSALAEGYSAGQREVARREAAAAWTYPKCAVRLDATTMAIVAGYPVDDGEGLAAWSDRVAHAAVRAGVRRVVLSGSEQACEALSAALETAGIEILRELPAPAAPAPAKRFRLWPLP